MTSDPDRSQSAELEPTPPMAESAPQAHANLPALNPEIPDSEVPDSGVSENAASDKPHLTDSTDAELHSPTTPAARPEGWQQGTQIDIDIHDLSNSGDGAGRWGDRVVFVPDTVPGDRVQVRLVMVKPTYARGKLLTVLTESPQRVRPGCIVADKCGGCQWQAVSYEQQLLAKGNQVVQALERIGGIADPAVDPILPSAPFGYRNKATYPLGRSPVTGNVQAGYYQKSSHKLVNLNQCPVQDVGLNPLLAEVKQDIQTRGWSIYNEERHQGRLRHLALRVGRRTGELLLTLVSTEADLPGLEEQAQIWRDRYPNLVGVCININPKRTNAIFGPDTHCIVGQSFLTEIFAELQFRISPTSFFQINTEQAEILLQVILDELQLSGTELLVDAYSGVGTLTLPLAQRVNRAIAIESHEESVAQGQDNAALNGIENVTFLTGAVETLLPTLDLQPDIVVLDPPRKGCDSQVLDTLLTIQPQRIVYVSCNPATLARDLKQLCGSNTYHLTRVQPVDFFPQTAHVECAAFLTHTSVQAGF